MSSSKCGSFMFFTERNWPLPTVNAECGGLTFWSNRDLTAPLSNVWISMTGTCCLKFLVLGQHAFTTENSLAFNSSPGKKLLSKMYSEEWIPFSPTQPWKKESCNNLACHICSESLIRCRNTPCTHYTQTSPLLKKIQTTRQKVDGISKWKENSQNSPKKDIKVRARKRLS